MVKKLSEKWILIFWTESCETSIVSYQNVNQVLKPKLIRVGWCGDLPWVDEYEITTLYEAKILRISCNKDYLESLLINVYGKVVKKVYSALIMNEKKKISADKKKKAKLQEKNIQSINELAGELPKIAGQQPHVKQSTINTQKPLSSDNHQKTVIKIISPTTSTGSFPTQNNNCENCKECICRSWRSSITPEYAALFGLQLETMNKYLSKRNPQTSNLIKIELFPNTGIFVTGDKLNLALSKSNFKHRDLVRQLLSLIVTDQELIAFKTAENMNKTNANIRNAIIGYIKNECRITLTTKEFNDIVRRRIELAVRNQKSPEELEQLKNQSIQRALKSRINKRKLLPSNPPGVSKKTKASDSTITPPTVDPSPKQTEDISSETEDETAIENNSDEKRVNSTPKLPTSEVQLNNSPKAPTSNDNSTNNANNYQQQAHPPNYQPYPPINHSSPYENNQRFYGPDYPPNDEFFRNNGYWSSGPGHNPNSSFYYPPPNHQQYNYSTIYNPPNSEINDANK